MPTVRGLVRQVPRSLPRSATDNKFGLSVAAPVFSPAAGTYSTSQSVTITCATSGASIYYTTDGSTPTTGSTLYTGAITVSSSATVRALSVKSGLASTQASAAYTITVFPLFVVIGESNAGGYAPNNASSPSYASGESLPSAGELAARSSVQIWDNTSAFADLDVGTNNLISHTGFTNNVTHGFEIALANAVEAGRFSTSTAYLLKCGQGGSTIAQWASGHGSGYLSTFQSRVSAVISALNGAGVSFTPYVIYSQGLNDNATSAATWQSSTETLITAIRTALGASTPVYMMEFSSQFLYANLFRTQMASIAGADALVTLVDTDSVELLADTLHLNYRGWLRWGERAIDATMAGATLATPTVDVAAGWYDTGTQSVTVSGPAGATLRYTTTGEDPSSHSTTVSNPISIASTSTLKVKAFRQGYKNSATLSAAYTIAVKTPVLSLADGDYPVSQSCTITCDTSGASIYYTTDGSTPTSGSTLYTGAITIAATTTLKAISIKSGVPDSAVATGAYTITPVTSFGTLWSYATATTFTYGSGVSRVNVFKVAGMSPPSGSVTKFKVTVRGNVTACSIAIKSGTDAYDSGTPTAVTFNGGSAGVTQGSGSATTSDEILLSWDKATNVIVTCWSGAGVTVNYADTSDSSKVDTYYVIGSDQTAVGNKSGLTLQAGYVGSVSTLECNGF